MSKLIYELYVAGWVYTKYIGTNSIWKDGYTLHFLIFTKSNTRLILRIEYGAITSIFNNSNLTSIRIPISSLSLDVRNQIVSRIEEHYAKNYKETLGV